MIKKIKDLIKMILILNIPSLIFGLIYVIFKIIFLIKGRDNKIINKKTNE